MNKEYIYKILHKPTGLFYCSRKGRFKDQITNLSAKGNFYTDLKVAEKVLKEDCCRADINKAQVERFGISRYKPKILHNTYSKAKQADFIIKKYSLCEEE